MKKINIILILGMMLAMLTSCHTSTQIAIFAEPGTEIYTPALTQLGVTDNSGRLVLEIDDTVHHTFLLSHSPGSKENVPFALDYKHRQVGGTKFREGLGMGMAFVGLGAMVGGLIPVLTNTDDLTGAFIALGGAVLGGIGCGIGAPADSRLSQTAYQYEYKYLPEQRTNQDFTFTQPEFSAWELHENTRIENLSRSQIRELLSGEPPQKKPSRQEVASTTVHRTIGQTSSKTLEVEDLAAQLEGTYLGSGKLVKGRKTIETYSGIKVILRRVSRDVVAVNVEESNSNKYFPTDSKYIILKQADGTFTLTMDDIPSATISIDTKQRLNYQHPRVNIDNQIYELKINANMK